MPRLRELADLVGGTVVGDGEVEVFRVAAIESAGEGEITFVANPRYLALLPESRATAVIVAPGVEAPGKNLLVSANPYLAFARILERLQGRAPAPRGILPGAIVAASARIGDEVTIHPGCVVGEGVAIGRGSILYPGVILYDDVLIGEGCVIHAGVIVREHCTVGNRVVIQPGAVIGADGFGFAPDGRRYQKIPQVGTVEIGDDVEIGAGSCIDRGTLGPTRIGRGTKIDNLVQVGHNVAIGEDTVIVAQVGIAGSSTIGRHCTLGGQAGVAGHLRIGDNVTIGGRGGVTNHVDDDQVLSGLPAIPHHEWLKASMAFTRLPEIRREVTRLKRQVAELEQCLKERP